MQTELNIRTRGGRNDRLAPRAVTDLGRDLEGSLLVPSDRGYDEARKVWNGMIDVRPALIARCASTADVEKTVAFAAQHDVALSVRSGGHNVAGLALVENGLVLDLGAMRRVEVDPEARIARVKGGARLGDIDQATQRHGLVTPSGFVSRTGIGGLLLRGGLGHTMRRFGLACDNLVAAELVTSDGKTRRITEESDPEALWALRGGPFDLGVVTELELRLHPLPDDVRMVLFVYPAENGLYVNRAVRDFMQRAPREVGLISFYVTLPEKEEFPESVRGREVIVLFGVYTGARDKADAVLAPLTEREDLIADLGGFVPYVEIQKAFDADYPDGMRYYWKSLYVRELGDDALEAIHRLGNQRPTPETTLDIWTMGGAIRDTTPETSAFPERNAEYMIAIETNWHDPADDETAVAWTRRVFDELSAYSSGNVYLNFPGSREEHQKAVQHVYAPVIERLRTVQRRLDPSGLFSERR